MTIILDYYANDHDNYYISVGLFKSKQLILAVCMKSRYLKTNEIKLKTDTNTLIK